MKCPHCKIHYMDEERVCPLCGTPNPHGKRSVHWDMEQVGEKQTKETPVKRHTQAKRKQVHTRPSSGWRQQERTASKTERKKGWIAGLVIVLLIILLAVAGSVIFASFDDSASISAVYEEDMHEAAFKKVSGTWESEGTGDLLMIEPENWSYTLGDQEKGYLELRSSRIEEQDGEVVYFYETSCYPLGQDAYTMLIGYAEEGPVLITLRQDGVDDEQEEARFWHRAEGTEA